MAVENQCFWTKSLILPGEPTTLMDVARHLFRKGSPSQELSFRSITWYPDPPHPGAHPKAKLAYQCSIRRVYGIDTFWYFVTQLLNMAQSKVREFSH